ncbi:ATP-binding protein [Streptomyces sp. NBC_01465]|uniref:ATP-binding protein n=1 Tax=Streptomyces sp. NBC_01465 TaxID=2903878 RepID=UPI002E328F29|nr:ATP-binding protein [Streptomyces sp. NBC_01465]
MAEATTEPHPTVTAAVVREHAMALPMLTRSVGLSRIQVRRLLTMWSWSGDVEDVVLVVSELVTNAINHGRVHGELLDLRLAVLEDGSLLVDVSDPVTAFPNFDRVITPGDEDEQGRGLRLVRAVGADLWWFLRQGAGGKTVRVLMRPLG